MSDNAQPTGAAPPERLGTLYYISQAINSSLDLDVVLDTVMDKIIEVMHAQRGFLMLRDDQSGELRVVVARGLNIGDLEDEENQFSTTVVNQVAQARQPLLTNNAEHDPRFAGGQSIIAMGLRSIVCVPILVKDRLIGVAYVDNSLRAGVFDDDDVAMFTAFAATAGIAIDNARLHRVEVENARRERELSMAHDIQQALLPKKHALPTRPGYDIAADWHSAREVAGDFYDVFLLEDDRLGVVIADVSDKGVSAALFMAASRSLLRGNAIASASPVETIHQTNRLIIQDSEESGMFVTAYYTIFEPGGRAVGVNAGHNLPLLYRHASGEAHWLPKGGWALGWFDDMPLEAAEIELQAGDVLVYYTDGLTEAENLDGEFFGEARLVNIVRDAAGQPAQAIADRILAGVRAFVGGAPPFDDLTLVVVRYTGAA